MAIGGQRCVCGSMCLCVQVSVRNVDAMYTLGFVYV